MELVVVGTCSLFAGVEIGMTTVVISSVGSEGVDGDIRSKCLAADFEIFFTLDIEINLISISPRIAPQICFLGIIFGIFFNLIL